jgi:hypothetical protein
MAEIMLCQFAKPNLKRLAAYFSLLFTYRCLETTTMLGGSSSSMVEKATRKRTNVAATALGDLASQSCHKIANHCSDPF